MLETLKSLLSRGEGHDNLETPVHQDAHFVLHYGDLEVGTLRLNQGRWHFEYAEGFKQQSKLEPLVDFPSLEKRYESERLWPFFALRIPSLEQPSVKRVIKAEALDEHNEAQLLERFGKRTIANPFQLEAA